MPIIITPATVGMWFIPLNNMSDFLGGLEQKGPALFVFTYRFRYYDPDEPNNDPFSGKDLKSWYEVTIPLSREEAIFTIRDMTKKLSGVFRAECDEVLVIDGNVAEYFEIIKGRAWNHMEPEEESV